MEKTAVSTHFGTIERTCILIGSCKASARTTNLICVIKPIAFSVDETKALIRKSKQI